MRLYLEDDRTKTESAASSSTRLHLSRSVAVCLTLFSLHDVNASPTRSAATMATSCQMWRPDRGRCFKTYGIVTVLFMDLVLQCVNGMFKELVIDLRPLGSLIWLTRVCVFAICR